MKKEARYVIRLANKGSYVPGDCERLLVEVRTSVEPLQAKAINLRVSRIALEFDLFCDPQAELHAFLTALEPLGAILTYKRLDLPPPTPIPAQVIAEARQLFNEERYWETHEVLEGLWKPSQGSEKQLLQGWILAAAAGVHVQKNELKVVWPMLEDAARRLENQPAVYYGLDVPRFLKQLKKMIVSKTLHFPTV